MIALAGIVLIALGVFAAIRLLNIGLTTGGAPPAPTPPSETRITVAFVTHDVAEGSILAAADVTLTEVPIELAPRDAITNLDNAIGRITKTDLLQGEMVLEHNLANPTGQAYDIAYVLDERHVLMALGVGDLMTREAIIKRGDIVDLLATYETDQVVTFDSFQRLDITAIVIDIIEAENANQDLQAPVGPQRSQVVVQAYLLALDPQNALVLKFLKDTGANFDLVLRAPTSSGQFQLTPVTGQYIRELYGLGLLP
ncbi:MAG: SAF domain-containing protein [Chloroflexota bacterium]